MPVESRIYCEHGLVFHRFSGIVRMSDIQAEMMRTLANPEYHAGLNEIVDLRDATETEIDFPQLLGHTRQLQTLQEGSGVRKTLFLVAGNELAFGMARMFQNIADDDTSPLKVHVVTEMEEAKGRLGVANLPL
ncbi:hypothetical protein [Aliiruegeria sabulilitoris]|uniref:hypothetical protein n=1 Tax=Aliiruegeria sabulilitoris TaxID=1510458 RepID=UPI0008362119|nr:hypothetical protein [Aliiruegeria sabulilitoris]NDR56437.1 hypothetical protein [Pseudoruegeria sp. M32A2M]